MWCSSLLCSKIIGNHMQDHTVSQPRKPQTACQYLADKYLHLVIEDYSCHDSATLLKVYQHGLPSIILVKYSDTLINLIL
jgi:hypothetical protein